MNSDNYYKEIIDQFNYSDFILHSRFKAELKELIDGELSGKNDRFLKALVHVLNLLKDLGMEINKADGHERLKYKGCHYYSLHLQQKQFNIRFLVYITVDHLTYFLCAFYERGGKSRTDYSQYYNVMESRYNELKGGIVYE